MIVKIGSRSVGINEDPFIIAEAGINHNGELDKAKEMIAVAKECGANAVKFQTFHAEEFIKDATLTYTYKSQGKDVTESMLDMFKRNEFSRDEWLEIKGYCDEIGITFLSTPQNVTDLELLTSIGVKAIKIGSDDFVNIPLIRRYSREGLPMLLACGMATKEEIDKTIGTIRSTGNNPIILLLCTSQYPTPACDANISRLVKLKEEYKDLILGLSDHTQGNEAAVLALALGARVFEKHFTLNHGLRGPDHWFSSDPEELRSWCNSIRTAYLMLGSDVIRPTSAEMEMRILAHRSITSVREIHSGEVFSDENLVMQRPGDGIIGTDWDLVIGKRARYTIPAGKKIEWKEIDG